MDQTSDGADAPTTFFATAAHRRGCGTRTEVDRQLGQCLRSLRLARGLSQQVVADAIGVSAQQLQKYERGINRVSVASLLALASALGTSADEMIASIARDQQRPAAVPLHERAMLLDSFARIGSPRLRGQVLHLLEEMGMAEAA